MNCRACTSALQHQRADEFRAGCSSCDALNNSGALAMPLAAHLLGLVA